MKKILALLLICTIVLAFASCANAPANQQAQQDEPAQTENTDTQESADAQAADFPTKNISWIVSADAGAPLDIPTRAIIENMDIDGNVIVENIAGASNTIGTLEAVNRDADGHTLVTTSSSAMLLQPLMTEIAYDPAEDLRVIGLIKPLMTYSVVVGPNSPYNSADEIMDLINSGERFTYTVSNAGAASHLAIVDALGQLESETGVFVPYNGGAEVTAALLNNEIDFAVLDTPVNVVAAEKGEVKVLMVMSNEEDPIAPGVPFIGEYGVEGMNAYFGLQCIAIRRDTPEEIVEILKEKINAAIMTEEYQQYLIDSGVGAMEIMDEAELEAELTNAREMYAILLEELGMAK